MNTKMAVVGLLVILLFSAIAVGLGSGDVKENAIDMVGERGVRGYTTHGVIRINNDTDFENQASQEGWPGNGTQSDPYIISGLDIDAHGAGYAIYIGNTSTYFVVENCYLHNASYHSYPYFYGNGITLYDVTNGKISGNDITNNEDDGTYLMFSSSNTISGNNITNNGDGIRLEFSSSNTISGNNITNNEDDGIYLMFSSSNAISGNNITNNGYGIYLSDSSSNTIRGNRMIGDSIFLDGNSNTFTTQKIDTNNTVNGKTVYYYKNANMDNATVPLGAGEVICGNVSWLKIEGLNLSNGTLGIEIGYSSNVTISENNITNNWDSGIYLYSSSYNIISNNICSNNSESIFLFISSSNNIIENNTCWNNTDGILVWDGSNNVVRDNKCTNNWAGIYLDAENSNIVKNNTIINNSQWGIYLEGSYSNLIENNTLLDNGANIGLDIGSGKNIINNNTLIRSGGEGITISSSDNIVENNFISSITKGLLISGYHNLIQDNVFTNNSKAIYLESQSASNTVEKNNLLDNTNAIYLYESNSNVIKNNTIVNSTKGIYTYASSHNIFENNTISNSSYGIYLDNDNSESNILRFNNISNNSNYGVYIHSGERNLIFANIFIGNGHSNGTYNSSHVQAYDDGSNNHWDNSTSGIGNYWYDWANNNNTNDQNHDGFVDWPYNIAGPAKAKDYYPLKYESLSNVLSKPQSLTANSGYVYVYLRWKPPVYGNGTVVGYRIYRNNSPIANVSAHTFSYMDVNVTINEMYSYYVTAFNTNGESAKSNEIEATPGIKNISAIRINSNSEFVQMAQQYGWLGNGSEENPYIISGYNIDAHHDGDAVYIGNTTLYFIVEHCHLYNASYHSDPYFDGDGIMLYNVTHGIIENNNITGNEVIGINVHSSFNNTIVKNNISGSYDGISVIYSSNIMIMDNNLTQVPWYNIYLYGASNNSIINNTLGISSYGVFLLISSNNTISENTMEKCSIMLIGLKNTFTTQNITNNTVNGKPIYYYKNMNMSNALAPLDAGEIILGNVSWFVIENLNLSEGTVGIVAGYSSHINITKNYITYNNIYGIFFVSTNNTVISNNEIRNNTGSDGIEMQISFNNLIYKNNISGNAWYGIELFTSSNNTIDKNNVMSNDNGGINLDTSSNNTLSGNNITNSGWNAIDLSSSSYNIITANYIANQYEYYGISIDSKSHNNLIYYNVFYNEWIYAHDKGQNNSWNTTDGIGNYWYSWATKNDTNDQNNDGIVDWPYKIDGSAGAKDYYPLKCPPFGNFPSSAPYNLTAIAGVGYVNLTWSKPECDGNSAIIEYKIYRNGAYLTSVPADQLWYNDTNVSGGITYTYYVIAVNSVGESGESNKIQAVPLGIPSAPQNLKATAGNGFVNLSWKAPVNTGGSSIIEYRIYRNGLLIATVTASQLWFNDTNVVDGQTYTYYVTAVNSVGESEKSNEVQATPGGTIPEFSMGMWFFIVALISLLGVIRFRKYS